MLKRTLQKKRIEAVKQYPVVTLTGPRQSGKTTLVKMAFPEYDYLSLEEPDHRAFALEDPRGFLSQFSKKVILDEIQRAALVYAGERSYIRSDSYVYSWSIF